MGCICSKRLSNTIVEPKKKSCENSTDFQNEDRNKKDQEKNVQFDNHNKVIEPSDRSNTNLSKHRITSPLDYSTRKSNHDNDQNSVHTVQPGSIDLSQRTSSAASMTSTETSSKRHRSPTDETTVRKTRDDSDKRRVSHDLTLIETSISDEAHSKERNNHQSRGSSRADSHHSAVDCKIVSPLEKSANEHVELVNADLNAFNDSFIAQRQAVIEKTSYQTTIKSWSPKSLKELVSLIKDLGKNQPEIDQHWIIFYWIACNIEYDTISYFSGNISNESAESAFASKKGVCAGYSRLYKHLCDQLNLKCEDISGYAKGFGFFKRPEGKRLQQDHAWNAVQINNYWYLLDSTWGTGHLNGQNVFERELDCFYFLTRPDQMIYDHLPVNERWQLLKKPISQAQYLQIPHLKPTFFKLNLKLISPRGQAHATLLPDKPYTSVVLQTPGNVELMASLELDGNKIEGADQAIFDKTNQTYSCHVAPPSTGKYMIQIFGKSTNSKTNSYSQVLQLPFNVDRMPSKPISYPKTWAAFFENDLEIVSPIDCSTVNLSSKASYAEVLLRAPDDVQLSCDTRYDGKILDGGSLAQFDADRNVWQCLFAPQCTGQHTLTIFAKRSHQKSSTSAVEFKLNVSHLQQAMKFPVVYGEFHNRKCRIYEPLNGVLKQGSTVSFHCVMPGALDAQLIIDDKWSKIDGSILKRDIQIGNKDLGIYAKYDTRSSYQGLVKYTVQ